MTEAAETATERCFDVAHLGHVEVLTDRFDDSLDFFTRVYGLTESCREQHRVADTTVASRTAYLRAWDDYEFHTLKLTEADTTGVGHIAYRAASPQALRRRAAAITRAGYGGEWTKGDKGHGRAYRFRSPDNHIFELYWNTRRYTPPPAERPALKNIAQRFHARGCAVRRLDHLNLLTANVAAFRDFIVAALGCRITEQIVMNNGALAGCWFTVNNKTYDLAVTADAAATQPFPRGRFHHITYAADQREDVLRAADIYLENGVPIETGPHKHAIQGTFFLYAFEPAGNRVEVANAGARLLLAPDCQTINWSEDDRKKGQAWGLQTIASFHTHGTPPHNAPHNAV